jgi:predicted AlkP superfamily phosphohydrolase/phosphomutase
VLREEAHTSATLRVRTLWSVLSTLGTSVGVVNWPLTYPASAVRGYLVSDEYTRLALTPSAIDDRLMLYPPELHTEAAQIVQAAAAAETSAQPVLPAAMEAGLAGRHQGPGRADRMNDRLARSLSEMRQPQVTILRYQSLDPIGHYFLRYAMPTEFGDVSDDERRQLGSVLERHYAVIDEAIGRAIAQLGPDDLLLVVSGYGMEPLGVGKRILERMIGDPDISGTHEAAPDGFLMAYGASVAKTGSLRRASVVDVVPTVLYFLGLPIGRDMDGYAQTDLFQPEFTATRPITFIPTYDR